MKSIMTFTREWSRVLSNFVHDNWDF